MLLLFTDGNAEVIPPRWASTVECLTLSGLCFCTAISLCCFGKAELINFLVYMKQLPTGFNFLEFCIRLSTAIEWWDAGMVMHLGQGEDLHMAQLLPLPLTVCCSSKSRLVFLSGITFLLPAHPISSGQNSRGP